MSPYNEFIGNDSLLLEGAVQLLKDIEKYLMKFIGIRTDEIGKIILSKHAEYLELTDELSAKFDEILNYIPQDRIQLLLDYEEKEQAQSALIVEIMYQQGLVDGMYLHRRFIDIKDIYND